MLFISPLRNNFHSYDTRILNLASLRLSRCVTYNVVLELVVDLCQRGDETDVVGWAIICLRSYFPCQFDALRD